MPNESSDIMVSGMNASTLNPGRVIVGGISKCVVTNIISYRAAIYPLVQKMLPRLRSYFMLTRCDCHPIVPLRATL